MFLARLVSTSQYAQPSYVRTQYTHKSVTTKQQHSVCSDLLSAHCSVFVMCAVCESLIQTEAAIKQHSVTTLRALSMGSNDFHCEGTISASSYSCYYYSSPYSEGHLPCVCVCV